MIRNALGSLMGLIGATAAVWSPFRAWYDGRHGRDYRIQELFSADGITDTKSALLGSILLPFLFAALLVLIAIVLRSRLLMAFAGVVVLGFAVLWMVRQGQAADGLSVGGDGQGLGDGLANAFGAGALLLLAAAVMSGRPSRRRRDRELDRAGERERERDRERDGARAYERDHDGVAPGTAPGPGAPPAPGTPGAPPASGAPGAWGRPDVDPGQGPPTSAWPTPPKDHP
ncbi:hypothetical protein SAVIM338S_03279 [Streptomyces avidinii]